MSFARSLFWRAVPLRFDQAPPFSFLFLVSPVAFKGQPFHRATRLFGRPRRAVPPASPSARGKTLLFCVEIFLLLFRGPFLLQAQIRERILLLPLGMIPATRRPSVAFRSAFSSQPEQVLFSGASLSLSY